jgi:hypothetical protein
MYEKALEKKCDLKSNFPIFPFTEIMDGKKIFEFTYVAYPTETPLVGLVMAILAFAPHVIPIIVFTRCITLKCFHHFWFFVGLVVSHGMAKVLKGVFKQPRPDGMLPTSSRTFYYGRFLLD